MFELSDLVPKLFESATLVVSLFPNKAISLVQEGISPFRPLLHCHNNSVAIKTTLSGYYVPIKHSYLFPSFCCLRLDSSQVLVDMLFMCDMQVVQQSDSCGEDLLILSEYRFLHC